MAETRKYLDFTGLQAYDAKIKALIAQAGKTEDEIKTIINDVVGALPEGATETTIRAYLESKINAVDTKVGDISSLTSETVTNLVQALTTEISRATAKEDSLATDIAALQKSVESLEAGDGGELSSKVTTLIGTDADKSVRTIANEEIAAQLIADNAKESLDTLTEIAAWIQSHPDDAAAMNADIEALETAIGTVKTDAAAATGLHKDIDDLGTRVTALETAETDTYTAITTDEINGLFTTTA